MKIMPLAIILLSVHSGSVFSQDKLQSFYLVENETPPTANAPKLSLDGFEKNPVLTRGPSGSWESEDVLNPSVVFFNGKYINYYSGYDGKTWRTGIATSNDGLSWHKYLKNPVLSPDSTSWDRRYIAANGGAAVFNGAIYYAYQGVDKDGVVQIGLAVSKNGYDFTKVSQPIISPGAKGSWDSKAVGDPYLYVKNGTLYLYYLGQNGADIQRLGVAKSTDGHNWVKSNANPVLDVGASGTFDENGLGEPSVVFMPPYFYMLYTGRRANEERNIGYATSLDGINWKKISSAGEIPPGIFGDWASKVICDTTFMVINGKLKVYFGGGNVASPDENLNGQIGLLQLSNHMTPASYFDPNNGETSVHSTDLLQGSYPIEGNEKSKFAWVKANSSIDLKRAPGDLRIDAWIPATRIRESNGGMNSVTLTVKVDGVKKYSQTFSHDEKVNVVIPSREIPTGPEGYNNVSLSFTGEIPPSDAPAGDKRHLAATIGFLGFK